MNDSFEVGRNHSLFLAPEKRFFSLPEQYFGPLI
jgi:hypothetical protein